MADLMQALPGTLQAVNVIILLSAMFFFTSTVASHLVEAFVGFWNSRGKQLRKRLRNALGTDAADLIYGHPLVRSISSGANTTTAIVDKINPPSYIEPQIFVDAVKNLVAKKKIDQNEVIKALNANAASFDTKLTDWFKSINDHQTGVYTRWTFLRLILVGFAFAVLMDLDTIQISKQLWAHPEQSEKAVQGLEDANKLGTTLDKLSADDRAKLQKSIAEAYKEVRETAKPSYAWQNFPTSGWDRAAKVFGWILTALATSLGAQFWFNIMSEALKLRSASKPKTKAKAKTKRKNKDEVQ